MNKDDKQQPVNNALRYSGIGFQIVGTFGAGVFIGYQIDKYMGYQKPYFTAALGLVFAFAGLYLAFRDLLKR
jgi:F0F1-type ATP synthase assembly protein I